MELALQRIREAKEQRLTRLEIGNCGLTEIPDEVFELVWLEELIVSNGWLEYSFEKEGWITYSSKNKGKANNIHFINPKIKILRGLKKIFTNGDDNAKWLLNDLSPLEELTQLQQISAFGTDLSNLAFLKSLTNLQVIHVSATLINSLTPLEDLTQLQQLVVSMTEVNDLSPLKGLTKLKMLSIYSTQVRDLEPLGNSVELEELYLQYTQVSDLSPLKDLKQLKRLSFFSTQVSDLSPLKDLAQLQQLYAFKTKVYDLKPLKDLKALRLLSITHTKVRDLRPLQSMIERGNELKWASGWADSGIYVEDCPLDKTLIAAIQTGHDAVLNYFNKPKVRLFEARVLVLGEPRAGKTTLRRKLKSLNAPMPAVTESTKAFDIEIEPYPCTVEKDGERNKMTYNLWDFGGQDYYRLLHQLFVAEQSVYVIVTDTDRNKNEEEIDFWLDTIQRLGRDKQGNYGPVVLFQNPKTNREGDAFLDLKKRYPFWQQTEQFVINLNALAENTEGYDRKEADKFRRFKQYLEARFCELDHIGREMPTQWVAVRKALNKHLKDNWISVEQFNKICLKAGIDEAGEQDDLLDIFHTLGYVLHYQNTALKGMVILNREWVTDALYRVLDDGIVSANKGWFWQEDAEKIWYEPHYKNRTLELLTLMQEFRLSYYNALSKKHIIPAKLSDITEGMPEWDKTNNVRLHLQYDWMPRALATQLIVSLHDNIVSFDNGEQWIWRRGAVLDGKKLDLAHVQVLIEDNWRDNTIAISAKGEHSELLIRTIMKNWRDVHEPFEDKVEVTKVILCPCADCAKSKKPHTFKYENVLNALEKNKQLQCNESFEEFSATDILRGVIDDTTASVDAFVKKGGRMSEEVKQLIIAGKIGQALEKLPEDETIVMLQYRLAQLNIKDGEGIVTNAEDNTERNKIIKALLSYLTQDFRFRDGFKR
jgi:internalin A